MQPGDSVLDPMFSSSLNVCRFSVVVPPKSFIARLLFTFVLPVPLMFVRNGMLMKFCGNTL